jgi:FixJ family two-component response regulator
MPGPQPPPIKLTDRQRKMLAHLVRRTTINQGLVRRAGIVLAAAEGANNQQIADRLGFDRETVRLWRGRRHSKLIADAIQPDAAMSSFEGHDADTI